MPEKYHWAHLEWGRRMEILTATSLNSAKLVVSLGRSPLKSIPGY